MFSDKIGLFISSLLRYSFLKAAKNKKLGFQAIMVMLYDGRAKHSLGPFAIFGYISATEDELKRRIEALKDFKHISVH